MRAFELVNPHTLLASDNTRRVVCESMDNQLDHLYAVALHVHPPR